MPEPRPSERWICTTEGSAALAAASYADEGSSLRPFVAPRPPGAAPSVRDPPPPPELARIATTITAATRTVPMAGSSHFRDARSMPAELGRAVAGASPCARGSPAYGQAHRGRGPFRRADPPPRG